MSVLLLSQLRTTLTHLDGQSPLSFSLADQHVLRHQLSATLKTLHELYPDGLTAEERQEFIATLLPLEHQFLQLTRVIPVVIPLATWQTLHQTLHAVIVKALALLA